MKLTIGDQQVIWNKEKNLFIIHILEPFYNAGRMYEWEDNPVGIGISEKIVRFAMEEQAKIAVHVGNNSTLYYITPKQILDFCTRYKSYYKIKNNRLLVTRWSEFKNEAKNTEVSKVS